MNDDRPVVTALPVTGSRPQGDGDDWRLVWTIAIAGGGYVGLGVLATVRDLRTQRQKVR